MPLHGLHLIGELRCGDGPATLRAANPATGEALEPPFREATDAEIHDAVEAAADAFAADRARPPAERAALLDAIADEIDALGDELAARMTAETGLPTARVLGERARTTGQLRLFAETVREGSWVDARIDTPLPDRTPPRPDLRRVLVPLGPVAVFGASNFPLAFSTAGGDTASALAAGCPVVVKAHPAHPGTAELVGEAVSRAVEASGFHAGTFSMLHASAPAQSLALVRHPGIRAVGFTGSLRAGRALFDAAAARPDPIPVYAEMGSVNPVVLLPGALDARGEAIADGLVASVTLGAGQFCTCPGLVLGIAGDALDAFTARVAAGIAATQPFTLLHDGIRDAYARGVARLRTADGVAQAAEGAGEPAGAAARAAVLVADGAAFEANPALAEEVFGPSTLIVACADAEALGRAVHALPGSLTATVHGTDDELAAHAALVDALAERAGRVVFGGFPTGVEVSPAMNHGGPYPATTDVRSTSVGTAALLRFARPVCFQDAPAALLPPALRDGNPLGICRMVDGRLTRDAL
jgi:NADP-dependent aldehyde dehydrogenase